MSKWKENFFEEYKNESMEFIDEGDLLSSDCSDLFSSDQSDLLTMDSKIDQTEETTFEMDEEEEIYLRPNIMEWDIKKLAMQITLIICKNS